MPELPEVETIRLGLQKYLVGKTIKDIDVRLSRIFHGETSSVIGGKVTGVRRFGKGLVISLDNSYSIAIHIKMTGQLIYKGADLPKDTKISDKVGGELPNMHTHVIFKLKGKSEKLKVEDAILYYNDIRQFGWIKIVKTNEVDSLPFFKQLGPEPIPSSGQSALTLAQFEEILKKSKGSIKPLLMDQKKIGGIGNIYANDALFLAKIHPQRPSLSLTKEEVKTLFEAIHTVLNRSLEVGGASEWQYVNVLGQTGSYQNFFQVYGKVGKPCARCSTFITKIVLAGRGTYLCPDCQQLS